MSLFFSKNLPVQDDDVLGYFRGKVIASRTSFETIPVHRVANRTGIVVDNKTFSAFCTCREGYKLNADNKTCDGKDYIYFYQFNFINNPRCSQKLFSGNLNKCQCFALISSHKKIENYKPA